MTRKEQKEKRRWQIISTALDLFISNGYAATKIQDIAEAVGMSVGLLFHYFESKEKLYEEMIKIGVSSPRTVLNGIKGEPLVFFQTTAKEILHFFETKPFVVKMTILMAQASNNTVAPVSVKKLLAGNDYIKPSVKIIKKGQKDGTIKEGDPLALAFAFWASVQGIAELKAKNPNLPIPDSEWIVDILRSKKSKKPPKNSL